MRNMSFAMTKEAVLNQGKTVTGRLGWSNLKSGDLIQPVEKCMGLKKGEKIVKIGCPIKIVSVKQQVLSLISRSDVRREGFPNMSPAYFIQMFCGAMRCKPTTTINRILFRYTTKEDTIDQ